MKGVININTITLILSNGVPAAAASNAASPAAPVEGPAAAMLTAITAVGVCVFLAWLAHCLLRPRKFSLAGTPARPNRLGPADILVLIFIWLGLQVGLAVLAGPDGRIRFFVIGVIAIPAAWFAVSLVVGAKAFRGGLVRGMGLSTRRWLADSVRGVVAYLALMPMCMAAAELAAIFLPPEMIHEHPLLAALDDVSLWFKVLLVFGAVVLAPLAEETFFRGLLQSALRARMRRPWAAIFITSAFFALIHTSTPQAVPALFILAVGMGYNYERTGRLYPAILIHAIFNAVMITALLLRA